MFKTFVISKKSKFESSEPLLQMIAGGAAVAAGAYYLYYWLNGEDLNDGEDINWKGCKGTKHFPGSLGLKNKDIKKREEKALRDLLPTRKINLDRLTPKHQDMVNDLLTLTNQEKEMCEDMFDGENAFADVARSDISLQDECPNSVVVQGASKQSFDISKLPIQILKFGDLSYTAQTYVFGEDKVLMLYDKAHTLRVVVVFDGHGGNEVSKFASTDSDCIDKFYTLFHHLNTTQGRYLRQEMAESMYKELNQYILDNSEDSGATMVALFFTHDTVHCLSAGDSFANVAVGNKIYKMGYIDDYDNMPIGSLIHNMGNSWLHGQINDGIPFKGWIKSSGTYTLSYEFLKLKREYIGLYPFGLMGYVKQIEQIEQLGTDFYECNPIQNWGFRGKFLQIASSLGDKPHVQSKEINKLRCFFSEIRAEKGCVVRFAMGSDGVGDWLFPQETVPPIRFCLAQTERNIAIGTFKISDFLQVQWSLMEERLKKFDGKEMESPTRSKHDDMSYVVGCVSLGTQDVTNCTDTF